MQDGAPPHCTNVAELFMKEKSAEELKKSHQQKNWIVWPARCPDFNSLDIHFWGVAQKQVYLQKPGSIEELMKRV